MMSDHCSSAEVCLQPAVLLWLELSFEALHPKSLFKLCWLILREPLFLNYFRL